MKRVLGAPSSGERGVVLRVRDDGCGGIAAHGNGLAVLREQVLSLGGTLELDSPNPSEDCTEGTRSAGGTGLGGCVGGVDVRGL